MSETSIEWTATVNPDGSVTPGKTWNPVTGCSKVSPGCAHCYAETVALRFWPSQYPPVTLPTGDPSDPLNVRPRAFTDVLCHQDRLDQPLRWRKPAKVFVNSMSDLFHEDVPDAFIDRVFAVMALAPQHTFQILTKRAERMRTYFSDKGEYTEQWYRRVFRLHRQMRDDGRFKMPTNPDEQFALGRSTGALTCGEHGRRFLPNVWLGVSVENQHFADERIPMLLDTPAAVRFISAEPLLGPVDLQMHLSALGDRYPKCELDWVIVGGESGGGARPFDVAWARSIVAQCKASGVPVFVKQLGANAFEDIDKVDVTEHAVFGPEVTHYTEPRDLALHSKKGGDPSEWPADLRIREFPRGGR